ncbi:MAG: valine--tRNA ligase, partial [Actinomycetota bacterium]
LIYRAERIINWCPRCLTALSDIEVEHSDDAGEFVQIRYGDDETSITVATTRAETMLGDGAVAIHPGDPRYQHLVGKKVLLPLVNRYIPIVEDELVDPEFGTGAVKVTAAHDPNDFEMGKRHGVEMILIMNEHGVMEGTGTQFDGMDRFDARKAVVEELRRQGRVVAEKRPYIHAVGHCQRCDTTVEPRLSLQWFVKVGPLAKAAADAVRSGKVKIEPESLAPRYFDWVDEMHDWCISRQLWWGHRIPVWYGPDGEMVVLGPNEKAPDGYTQDPDVLDTWFSSALWPFSTLGWPDASDDLKKFYPTSVLVTGYDILFFWVARMMMFGLFAMDGVPPFDVIALHGLVRDKFGKKMSKSRGNTIDPLEFMDKYGSDALRFTLARGSNPGADMAMAEEWVAGSRNFATKLWNATRFALLNGAHCEGKLPSREKLSAIDIWILELLQETTNEMDANLEDFEFSKASEGLYHFAWDDLCDWYLELSKASLAEGGESAEVTKRVLGEVLDRLFRALHPFMPYITEELWCTLTGGQTLVTSSWPKVEKVARDKKSQAIVDDLKLLVTEIRRFRNDQGAKSSAKISAKITGLAERGLDDYEISLRSMVKLEAAESGFSPSGRIEVGSFAVEFDLTGTVDVEVERARLSKDLATIEKDLATAKVKLENENFMAKAPLEVIEEIRGRHDHCIKEIERIKSSHASLPTK